MPVFVFMFLTFDFPSPQITKYSGKIVKFFCEKVRLKGEFTLSQMFTQYLLSRN